MNSEYILTKEQIMKMNEMYGGSVRNDAEIETSLELGKGKSIYRKIAYLLRAILVGHPFSDANKRTALMVAITMLKDCCIELNDESKENLVSEMRKIAKENITDITNIERLVRYAVTGD